jgi:hypothetical protein
MRNVALFALAVGIGCASSTSSQPPATPNATTSPVASATSLAEVAEAADPVSPDKPHNAKPPLPAVVVQGHLGSEVVQKVVRKGFAKLRYCYELALQKDPKAAGTIIVRFIIDTTGAVESAHFGGGTLTDDDTRKCMLDAVRKLTFPEPDGGKVMVTYPFEFTQDE